MGNIRSDAFYLVTGESFCWKCRAHTHVSAIVLDGYHEHDEDERWLPSGERTMLGYVTAIDQESLNAVQAKAPWLMFCRSATAQAEYLGNCCEECTALQGEWFLKRPGDIFFPAEQSRMQPFVIDLFNRRIHVEAELALSSWYDWLNLPTIEK